MSEITVGLPVVAGLKQFEMAVRSIFAQTHQNWQLIIVCDGAPAEISQRALQIQDHRVQVHAHNENRGLPYRLNQITQYAKTEYIARMDSDDMMLPERLARLISNLKDRPDIDVLGSGSYLVNENYEVQGSYDEPKLPNRLSGYLSSGVFSHPTVAYKTSWGLANPYDPSRVRTEDKELWLRTASRSVFSKLDDRLLFCMVPSNLSVEKQALTARFDRKLMLEMGNTVAPQWYVYMKTLQSLTKQFSFATAHRMGLISVIHRTKFTRLNANEMQEIKSIMSLVKSTKVPGWD